MTRETPSQDPYGFKPFPYSSHDLILKMLACEKPGQRILDLGAATGYLGNMLRKQGHYVVGIDKDSMRAREARGHYDDFYCADLEEYEFPQQQEFDCIIFGDVLEHLREPELVLRKSFCALKKSGRIIISVPNVANIFVRISLLFGKFDYAERGILDRGHLRFFTLKTLKEMLGKVSCDILEMDATPLPFQLVFPATQHPLFIVFHTMHYRLVGLWKTMLAYQLIVKAARIADLS